MISPVDFQTSLLLSAFGSRQGYARTGGGAAGGGGPAGPTVEALLRDAAVLGRKGGSAREVTCLVTDSRRVVPGALFFAMGGLRTDGNLYVEEAVDRGAVAVVTEEDYGAHFPIDFIRVKDVRETLAVVAKRFHNAPDAKLRITGITGTNGKTTVAMLAQHLLGPPDSVGLIGTIRYDLGRRTLPSFRTTPEAVDTYALLEKMAENGCRDVVMEISSHGIDQKRVNGLEVDVAVFLNLTRDHLDYHGTMENYYSVKRRLFTGELGRPPEVCVIHTGSDYGQRLRDEVPAGVRVVDCGGPEALIRAENIALHADRTEFEVVGPAGRIPVRSPLLGRYNVDNVLAALAIGHAHGHRVSDLAGRLGEFPGVPGRMERIERGQPFTVVVDYAHTDDALRHACGMLAELVPGRLLVVFGCGGNRDRSKRGAMLEAVLGSADRVFATADNPRTEPLERIFADMREGCPADHGAVAFIAERREAISAALEEAAPGDCVLIAGKGHETYQEFDGTVAPFDDRQVARELLDLKSPEWAHD